MTSRWFPDSGPSGRVTVVLSHALLELHHRLRLHSPRMANHGFVSALLDVTRRAGRPAAVSRTAFNRVSTEWQRLQMSLSTGLTGCSRLCPACKGRGGCRFLSTDTNSKVERYRSKRKDDSRGHYLQRHGEPIFLDTDVVEASMTQMYEGRLAPGAGCGNRVFKAVAPARAKSAVDVTGVTFSMCPHSLVVGATEIYRGEQMGPTVLLIQHAIEQLGGCDGTVYDVACQLVSFLRSLSRHSPCRRTFSWH